MDWKDFFQYVEKEGSVYNIEELYQAFKARLIDELIVDVPNASHYGRLLDKDGE